MGLSPSGGPVKQTLQDSTSAIYERLSLNTVSWGAWGRNYNSVAKPKLGSDLLDSTGAVLTDASTLNKNQQWTDVGGTGKPSDNAGTSVTFYDPQNGYATRGNSFGKSQFNNSWQVNLWTRESYYGSAMVSGEFVGQDIFIGLSFNGQNIDNYAQLEYAIYARGDNQIDIYQSGTGIVTLAYAPGAGVYAITYDGVSIKYWLNNTLIYTHPGNPQPGWTMYAGFNAYAIGNGVKNIQFSSFTDNAWSSVGGPNRPADNATVGAPNGTYVGGTLAETVAGNANNPAAVINRNTVTIDGGKLTAGTVDTLQLKAGAVSTDKLLVGSMSYLNPDPGFRDNSFWVNNGVYNGSLGTSAGSVPAWYNSHGTDINDAMGTTNYCMLWEAYFGGTGRQHLISGRRNGIKGGTTYQLSALGRNAASQRIYVLCRMYDTNGTYIADAQLFWDASIGKDYKKTQFVAPPNATSYQFYVFNEAPGNNWGGNAEIADLQVTEAAGATAIMDGAIVTKHMTANTIKGDVIEAGTLMADKLVANSITTGKLAVQNRPVSVVGINMRIENDNVVRWNAGKIIFPDNNGNYVTRSVVAGATGWGGWDKPVNFCYDSNGDNQGLGVYYSQDLPAYASQLPVAIWNNGKDLVMRAGTSTLINGDNIQTGTIAASKLIADSITANEIQSGAIGAAEIAAGAIVATKLAIGSTDSIVPDSDFRDPSWWNSGIPDGRLSVEDVAFSQFRRALAIRPNGGIDVFSPFFPVEPGATYKITMGVDCAADFNGIFRPLIHMPGVQWYSPKYGAGVDPSDVNPVLVFNAAGQSENIVKTFTNPNIVNVNQWQFRLMGSWTGTVRFAIKIVRVSDTTLIADGAITTPKIIVGSLDGDRIATNTLDANTIKAGSILAGSVVVGGAGALGNIATQAANAGNNAWWTVAGDRYAITNNKITKLTYNDWDYNCYTQDLFQGSCIMTGKLTSDGTFIGISDGRENGNYGNIDYAWHRSSDGNTYMFQSGANVGGIGSNGAVGADSVNFTVVYDGRTVRWYRNEFLHREVDAGPNRAFSGAVGIAAPGAYVERLSFQPGTDNSLTRADVTGKINAGTTTINGGKITTGSIGADQIAANSIIASKLSINNRNISVIGCDFRYQDGRLWWSDGHILYTDDNGNSSSPYIPAASVTWNGGSYNYIVWDKGAGGFRQTPPDGWEPSQNNASNSVIMCTWRNGTNFNANYGGTIVSGDRIVTKSIGADQINVGSLSALSANIGSLVSYNGAGGRVERDGNGTRIYDNNGTLRSWSGF
ncbi:hypothetical protein [Sphingomonas sp. Leaf242]|uniref:hypothetical protein n=1 Tax=Sphingomonas sp. Leaf242 TaxID=1736304 RepID=UPI000AD79D18|nr:hypothetical protein [Sphingomonas sp. Leaf242]